MESIKNQPIYQPKIETPTDCKAYVPNGTVELYKTRFKEIEWGFTPEQVEEIPEMEEPA